MLNDVENITPTLKMIARNKLIQEQFYERSDLYELLLKAASRYITGETMQGALNTAKELFSAGYKFSIEFMGEDTTTEKECELIKNEFFTLIEHSAKISTSESICFDLSNIGLYINQSLAIDNLIDIANFAKKYNYYLMISMEESAKTQAILDVYLEAAKTCNNVGITLQAQLFRSLNDVEKLLEVPGKIRLVKGVYDESNDISFRRSHELNQRYLQLIDIITRNKHPLTIATHDPVIIDEVVERGYLDTDNTEIEMLHGVTPQKLKSIKDQGYATRVYLTYGTKWFLHFCHRLAEYPPNIYQAITDCLHPNKIKETYYF
jgi:proline dehydrogenase